MKTVKLTTDTTINNESYKADEVLNVCDELYTDLVEVQKCAILHVKTTPKKEKKGK